MVKNKNISAGTIRSVKEESKAIVTYLKDRLVESKEISEKLETDGFEIRLETRSSDSDIFSSEKSVIISMENPAEVSLIFDLIPSSLLNTLDTEVEETKSDGNRGLKITFTVSASALKIGLTGGQKEDIDFEFGDDLEDIPPANLTAIPNSEELFSVFAVDFTQPRFSVLVDESKKLVADINTYYNHTTTQMFDVEREASFTNTESEITITLDSWFLNPNSAMYLDPLDYPIMGWITSISIDEDADTVDLIIEKQFEDASKGESQLHKYPSYLFGTSIFRDTVGLAEYTCSECGSESVEGYVFSVNEIGVGSELRPSFMLNCYDCESFVNIPLLLLYSEYPMFHKTINEYGEELWDTSEGAEIADIERIQNQDVDVDDLNLPQGIKNKIEELLSEDIDYMPDTEVEYGEFTGSVSTDTTLGLDGEVINEELQICIQYMNFELSGLSTDLDFDALLTPVGLFDTHPSTRCILCGMAPEQGDNAIHLADRDTEISLSIKSEDNPISTNATDDHLICESCSEDVEQAHQKVLSENRELFVAHNI